MAPCEAPAERDMPELKTTAKYRELVREFKPDSGQLLACLHKIQHEFGYIPTDAVPAVAQQLRLTAATVFGAITFYSEFFTQPPADVTVHWCSGPACRLRGGDNIRQVFESVLGISMEETTADKRVGLHLQQCDGSCQYAPLVWLKGRDHHGGGPDRTLLEGRGEIHGPLTVPDAVQMARKLKAGEDV